MRQSSAFAALAILAAACTPKDAPPAAEAPAAAPRVVAANAIEAGRYLVKIGGCNDCHTPGFAEKGGAVPESEWLIGERVGYMGPWGTSYPSNLRLSVKDVPEEAWIASIRARNGLPPMPWPSLHAMDDADLSAIYQYIKSLPEKGAATPLPAAPGQQVRGAYYYFVPITGAPPK